MHRWDSVAQANPDVSRQLIPADQPHGGSRVAVGSTLVRPAPMVRGACTPHQLGFQLFQLDSFDGSLPQHREFQPSVHNLRLSANPLLISAPHSRVGRKREYPSGPALAGVQISICVWLLGPTSDAPEDSLVSAHSRQGHSMPILRAPRQHRRAVAATCQAGGPRGVPSPCTVPEAQARRYRRGLQPCVLGLPV